MVGTLQGASPTDSMPQGYRHSWSPECLAEHVGRCKLVGLFDVAGQANMVGFQATCRVGWGPARKPAFGTQLAARTQAPGGSMLAKMISVAKGAADQRSEGEHHEHILYMIAIADKTIAARYVGSSYQYHATQWSHAMSGQP